MSSGKSFFVTGTGTGVGKTYVSSVLVNGFCTQGSVSYMKPIQTGCTYTDDGTIVIPDFEFVKSHAPMHISNNLNDHIPYCFEPACSPHLAASKANQTIDFKRIRNSLLKLREQFEIMIVEGAGGIFAPVSETTYMVDLIAFLCTPVILVTTPALGTLNHTFLTISHLKSNNIPLAGIVMNCNDESIVQDYIYTDNKRMIQQYAQSVPFLEITYGAKSNERVESFCRNIR